MIGQTLSHFKITAKLGEGGMGEVYRATDTKLGREVAIKVLPEAMAADSERLERFKREAKSIAALNHPNIVTIYSVEDAEGVHFLTMELVEGETMADSIPANGLPLEGFFELAVPLSDALTVAHEKGIIHRDLKPSNIMVSKDGRVKVLDFGLAKLRTDERSEFSALPTQASTALLSPPPLTGEGTVLGTVPYMSPEQLQGQALDHRSDVFSLGLILYEMATGQSAFLGDTYAERISSILRDQPAPVIDLRAELPHHLGRVIRRCLEKDPDRRYQTARDVLNELEDLGTELVVEAARPASHPGRQRARPVANRPPIRLVALAALVIAVASAGAYYGWRLLTDRSSAAGGPGEEAGTAGATTEIRRLAVLPFTNLRQDPETDFLGYALADQVISRLEYLSNLLVRPSSAVRAYQDRTILPSVAAEELQVDYLLTGNYLKEGDLLRLNLELVNARSNESIWREPIEVRYDNVFALQDLVTEKVTDGLLVRLSGDERRHFGKDIPRDPLAYEYYLRALSYPFTSEGHELAVEMLRQSMELDAEYAPAFEELGHRLQQLATYTLAEENALREEAMAAVQRALELNPEQLQALSLLSTFYTELGPLEEAFDVSLRALEVNPRSPYLHFSLGYAYRYAGLLEESAREYETAITLDPGNRRWRSAGITHLQLGNYEDALRGFDLDPESSWSMSWKGLVYAAMGREEEALEHFERVIELEGDGPLANWARAPKAVIEGDLEQGLAATKKLEELALADGEWRRYTAMNYCSLGDQDGCLRELEAALEHGYYNYPPLVTDPLFDLVRDSERFKRVLAASKERHEAIKSRYGFQRQS